MKRPDMVDINKEFVKEKIRLGGFKYVDLARILGKTSKGSLTCAISCERMRKEDLIKLARIADFSYEEALKHDNRPKAYIKRATKIDIMQEIDKVISLQKEINITLIKILNMNIKE